MSSGSSFSFTPGDKPKFTFGTATTGTAATGGTTDTPGNTMGASTPAGGSSLFGNPLGSTPATGSSPFGQASSGGSALFGGTAKPAGSLFANTSTTQSSGGLFGNASATPSGPSSSGATTATGGLFGGSIAGAGGASSFGNVGATKSALLQPAPSTTAATFQTTPAKPALFASSTTPAGAPPVGAASSANVQSSLSGFSLGGSGNTGSAPAPSGGLFGNPSSTPATQAKFITANVQTLGGLGGGLFGAKPSSSTPTTTGAVSTATTRTMFGAPPAVSSETPSTTTSTTATTRAPSALFGASATTATPASSAATASSIFGAAASTAVPASSAVAGSSLFGSAAPATSTTSSTATAPAALKTPALFGQLKPATSAASASAPEATATTTSATPSGLDSGTSAAGASGAATDSLQKPAAASAPSAATSSNAGTSGLAASTMGPTSQLPRLKNKTMDEIITRWATDLSKYQKEFKEQAAKISEWDRVLVENGEKIQKLFSSTYEAERASHEIERQLASVESQQDELATWLDKYEKEVDELGAKQHIGPPTSMGGPDQERERTYKMAEKLTDRLDEMGKDLSKMIKEINDMSGILNKGNKPDDPLSQIVRVLNGHLAQLQWIDTNSAVLQAKVSAAQKASAKMGNTGGYDNEATEGFYRSYMGRK